ncbi:hypothetical protein HPB51_003176 [Rhipicephalus microplus]|uniref:Uncharacterized protein n=1 Tax=Rhipicephalus microplus TaxID=6941 RepID=A0A9J6EK86_RHIMP|nr:hypothetical protein HPB51_003176 [Rhipicephalus microplus]
MASGGISRSGRVRKKSAKLMEMEDWDAFDLNDAPSKAKKRPRSPDPLSEPPEKKVAPIKIAKAAASKASAVSPVKARAVDGVIHLKNLQNIQESGYLNVPTASKAVPVAQHQPLYDSSSSSSESSETSSDEESDSDDSMEYARPLPHMQMQQKGKKPTFQMLPQAKTVAAESQAKAHDSIHVVVSRIPPQDSQRQPGPWYACWSAEAARPLRCMIPVVESFSFSVELLTSMDTWLSKPLTATAPLNSRSILWYLAQRMAPQGQGSSQQRFNAYQYGTAFKHNGVDTSHGQHSFHSPCSRPPRTDLGRSHKSGRRCSSCDASYDTGFGSGGCQGYGLYG